MKIFEKNHSALIIELDATETKLLKHILSDYPLAPNESRRLSAFADADELQEHTRLLQSSLNEHTRANRAKLQHWMASPETWQPRQNRTLLTIKTKDRNWLLQILNDLRIGSWQKLHCPGQEELAAVELHPESAYPLWTMEISGLLQTLILNAP